VETCSLCDKKVKARGLCSTHYNRWKEGKEGSELTSPTREYAVGKVEIPPIETLRYDTEWQRFCAWLGIEKERIAAQVAAPLGSKVVHGVISDLHIPFHDPDSLVEAVEWMVAQGATILHVGGDVADHYNLSRFSQYESVDIQYESIECRKVLDYLSRNFTKVEVIAGNHEAREQKYLATKLPPDLLQWFLNKSFLERITEDMDNVHVMKHSVGDIKLYWISPIGKDVILTHAETSSKLVLKAVDNVRAWINNWHEAIGLDRPRIIMQAHVHAAGIAPIGPQIICETGCICKIQGYALEPRLYGKPQVQVATVFTQVDGVTDINSIQQRYLGV